MDFITHVPSSAGQTVVWVICVCLTKYTHFLALLTHFTAQQLAKCFAVEIFHLHKMSKTIVSDRDPFFVSTFWRQLFKVQGTTLKFISTYHSQTDGQTEVLNKGLEAYLRCFTGDTPKHGTNTSTSRSYGTIRSITRLSAPSPSISYTVIHLPPSSICYILLALAPPSRNRYTNIP